MFITVFYRELAMETRSAKPRVVVEEVGPAGLGWAAEGAGEVLGEADAPGCVPGGAGAGLTAAAG